MERGSMTTRHKKAGQSEKKTTPAPLFDHHFQRPELLTWALTHRSLAYETNPDSLPYPTADNEQLEFVGDAVLGLVVAESLFHRFSASREGELTRLRSSLVSRRHLGEVAARIDLGSPLRLRRGGEQHGRPRKASTLSAEPSATTNPRSRSISRPPAPASPTMSSPTRVVPTIKNASAS